MRTAAHEDLEGLLPAAYLVVELVGILDEKLEALRVCRREAVEPNLQSLSLRIRQCTPDRGSMRFQVVEQVLVPSVPGRTEGDDLQQVELAYPPAHEGLQHLWQLIHVVGIDHDVDVDHQTTGRQRRADAPRGLIERAVDPDERIVHAGGAPMHRDRDLVEPGFDGAGEKLRVREHAAVGHGLHPAVAGALA